MAEIAGSASAGVAASGTRIAAAAAQPARGAPSTQAHVCTGPTAAPPGALRLALLAAAAAPGCARMPGPHPGRAAPAGSTHMSPGCPERRTPSAQTRHAPSAAARCPGAGQAGAAAAAGVRQQREAARQGAPGAGPACQLASARGMMHTRSPSRKAESPKMAHTSCGRWGAGRAGAGGLPQTCARHALQPRRPP